MDPLDEIRRLYFNATRATIQRDFERALDLLKSMNTWARDRSSSSGMDFSRSRARSKSRWMVARVALK